jgi:hypothetical protein
LSRTKSGRGGSREACTGLLGAPDEATLALYVRTKEVLAAIRKRKSEQGLSAGARLDRVLVHDNDGLETKLREALPDLTTAVRADVMEFVKAAEFSVEIFPKAQERGA